MTPFREVANRIRWTPGEDPAGWTVVFVDRLDGEDQGGERLSELSLPDFLESDVPEHRVRKLRSADGLVVWERRRPGEAG